MHHAALCASPLGKQVTLSLRALLSDDTPIFFSLVLLSPACLGTVPAADGFCARLDRGLPGAVETAISVWLIDLLGEPSILGSLCSSRCVIPPCAVHGL